MKNWTKRLGVLCIAWICAILLFFSKVPQEPELLQRAQLVASADQWQLPDNYVWTADSKLFCQRQCSYKLAQQSGPYWFDTNTKTATYDAAMKARVYSGYDLAWLSPDHAWLLNGIVTPYNVPGQPVRAYYELAALHDGSTIHRNVNNDFLGAMWCSDSHHWIEFMNKPAPPGTPAALNRNLKPLVVQHVSIRSVDKPYEVRSVAVAPGSLLAEPDLLAGPFNPMRHMFALAPDRFLIWSWKNAPLHSIIVQEIRLQDPKPLRKFVLALPKGKGLVQLIPSPNGDRFLLKLRECTGPNLVLEVVRQYLLHQYDLGHSQVSLWVSGIDGSAMHEIGAAPSSRIPISSGGPGDRETGEHLRYPPVPRQIRWLPNGRHVSFSYKEDLYTISGE